MAEIPIPGQYKHGLTLIRSLNEKAAGELIASLNDERPALVQGNLAENLSARITKMSKGDTEDIVDTLLWLAAGLSILNISVSELADDVSSASDLELSEQDQKQLADRLVKLLSAKSITVTGKALDVLNENDRNFYDARIMTEIRPIFGESVEEQPQAAVIVHTLKIEFHHEARHEQFFIALDTKDVGQLRDVLDRADKKAASLKSMLSAAGITYLEPPRI